MKTPTSPLLVALESLNRAYRTVGLSNMEMAFSAQDRMFTLTHQHIQNTAGTWQLGMTTCDQLVDLAQANTESLHKACTETARKASEALDAYMDESR